MAIVHPDLGDNVPESLKETIESIGLFVPDELQGDEQQIYHRAVVGRCMTCEAELGETMMACINQAGVVMMFCSGACYSDMQVMGYLQEQHEDIVDKVKFRGGQGDGAPE